MLPAIDSIAKSLGARRVSESVFERCKAAGPDKVKPWVTTDAAAVSACCKAREAQPRSSHFPALPFPRLPRHTTRPCLSHDPLMPPVAVRSDL